MNSINWKFESRRKEETFVVLPAENGKVIIQSDKSIAEIDIISGQGLLNAKGSNDKYFLHLSEMLGAVKYSFPAELVELVKSSIPNKGDVILGSEESPLIVWG